MIISNGPQKYWMLVSVSISPVNGYLKAVYQKGGGGGSVRSFIVVLREFMWFSESKTNLLFGRNNCK